MFGRKIENLNTDIAAFFIASPLPGTRFYKEANAMGLIRKDANWIDYSPLGTTDSVVNLPGLSIKEIKAFHKKAMREYYVRVKYIVARLLRIRHWHEVVNMWEGVKLLLKLT